MDHQLYGRLGVFKQNKIKLDSQDITLFDLANSTLPTEKFDLIHAYCSDLKNLLELDLVAVIKGVFAIDQSLQMICEKMHWDETEDDIPILDALYLRISPLLLRGILNCSGIQSGNEQRMIKTWLEALRVALEEEIYEWQDRLLAGRVAGRTTL